jgi:hypothetical protein
MLGSNQVIPEMKSDPPNLIPRFVGQQPVGGAVFNDTKPEPWIEAHPGTGGRGGGNGAADYQSLEERMFNDNKRDWVECIKSRKAAVLQSRYGPSNGDHLQPRQHVAAPRWADHSLGSREGSGRRRQGSRRHVQQILPRPVGRSSQEPDKGIAAKETGTMMTRRDMLAAAGSTAAFFLKGASAEPRVLKHMGVASTSFGARMRAGGGGFGPTPGLGAAPRRPSPGRA